VVERGGLTSHLARVAQNRRSDGRQERRDGNELMSIFGWLTLKEAERYTRTAGRKEIAGRAMTLLERGEKRT
jgi:hypothetical protein